MPRFVILTHDWPFPHLDFLAECGGVLRAWRLLAEPVAGEDIPAEPNFDHRLFYLDYEGPVSGNRGTVQRWDAGDFTWISQSDDRLVLDIRGQRVQGMMALQQVEGVNWELRC